MSDIRHIHMIAACGTGTGSLAGLLKGRGYHVTGSDQNIYPPMSTELETLGIHLYQGFKPENLIPRPDLVIVGNAVSKDNPEVVEMLKLGIPYLSMPQAVSQFFITGKKSIVIAGTHGKTTTTAIMAHCLTEMGQDPGFLIGGVLHGEKNYADGTSKYFVIEGDEYDTAFFDKGSKFLHYQPCYTIITSLEFDHADIYRDLDHMTESFAALIAKNNPDGLLLVQGDSDRLTSLSRKSGKRFETYGLNPGYNWCADQIRLTPEGSNFDALFNGTKEITIHTPMSGKHNVQNTLAVYAMLRQLGFEAKSITAALTTFKGVKRRQEVRGIVGDVVVIDDFAHHPTAVAETIAGVRAKYPEHILWAVFEPRSASAKRAIFQDDYAKAFDQASEVILADVFMPEKVKDAAVLSVDTLALAIDQRGISARHLSGTQSIVTFLKDNIAGPSVILIMSNGGFGGIHDKVLNALQDRKTVRGEPHV